MTEATEAAEKKPPAKTENMIKADVLQDYVKKIENIKDEQASEQGAYMQQCSVFQGRIKDLKKQAKGDGIPQKELNTILADRDLDRKKRKLREELEPDQKLLFDQMKEALGPLAGTPLGEAAQAATTGRAATTAPTQEAKVEGIDAIAAAMGLPPKTEPTTH